MPVDNRRVKELFVAAIGVADPAERAAFVDRECAADAGLRDRVAALLAAHAAPASALDRPLAVAGPDTDAYHPAAPPTRPHVGLTADTVLGGRFKLLERIGE